MELFIQARHKDGVAEATVPFENGIHKLPKIFPFNKTNNYVGPDAGYSLDWVSIDTEKRTVTFGYQWTLSLDEEGKAQYELGKGDYAILFLFSLK